MLLFGDIFDDGGTDLFDLGGGENLFEVAVASSLILDMPMQDDAASTAVDDVSDSDNNGTASANTNTLSVPGPGGIYPKALKEDSATITLASPITIEPDGEATIEFFSNAVATGYTQRQMYGSGSSNIITGLDEFGLQVNITDEGGLTSTTNPVAGTTGISLTTYYHLALVFHADGTVHVYNDADWKGTVQNEDDDGDYVRTDQIIFNEVALIFGPIAGWRVYNEARTQPQIAADMALGLSSPDAGCVSLATYANDLELKSYSPEVTLRVYACNCEGCMSPFDNFDFNDEVTLRTATRSGTSPWSSAETGDPVDPDTVTFRVRDPTGEVESYVYESDDEVERVAAGDYRMRLPLNQAGTWQARVEGTGDGAAADWISFTVAEEWNS